MRTSLLLVALVTPCMWPSLLAAQTQRLTGDPWCETHEGRPWLERSCEVRERLLSAGALLVDGGQNGGIEIRQWDRSDVLVRVRIEAQAETADKAMVLQRSIRVHADSESIRAVLPSLQAEEWTSTAFRVYVPRRIDLDLRTANGLIRITGVSGKLNLRSHNGSLQLANVGGTVKGETTNGGIHLILAGRSWNGAGVELVTSLGGVTAEIPMNFAADLSVTTHSGAFTIHDLPLACTPPHYRDGPRPDAAGCRSRRVRQSFNGGGPPVILTTRTGGVDLRRALRSNRQRR